ncbi:pyridoxal phosphate-dependent aminotransferase [Streptomyces sp. NBC_01408]|uniref:pyridoxal phosphate-dependent aminotransferase n=1 Tax=Streptomyces sp. NBC_01408 TaxID=2903855 RepID=UPI0022510071|nr:pyridoxal phosphate-dependent aminotransferase [Streptomyces sp. NBC_01408]MCX4692910.1 pyridoxal phosphate-dependent aminotransferase [Streptomyces sp. NBC_01408]
MTDTRLSRRAAGLPPLGLAALLPAARAGGATDLALGIPVGDPPRAAVDAAAAALRSGSNQYADPAGLLDLRLALAAQLTAERGVEVDAERELTVCAGATEGLLVALIATTDPGDEVLIPSPFFENHPGVVELAGAVPRFAPLTGPGWRLTEESLDSAVTPRTRALLLNNPHNPTGRVFDEAEFAALSAVCERHDLTLIIDEVYDRFVYDGRSHLSPLGSHPGLRDRTVVVGSLSKTRRMSGWRLGFCVARPSITAAVRSVHERTTLGTPHPLQLGALALGAVDEAAVDEARTEFQTKRDLVCAGLRAAGFTVHPPEGGWFLLAGTAGLGRRSSALARELVEHAKVLVAPGASFFPDREAGEDWVRIALVRDRSDLAAALGRVAAHLS